MRQGINHFSGFLHHFVLAKLSISSIRVRIVILFRLKAEYCPGDIMMTKIVVYYVLDQIICFSVCHCINIQYKYSNELAL